MQRSSRPRCTSFCLCLAAGLAAGALQAQSNDLFFPYDACSLPEGPSIVETAPLAPGVKERTVTTSKGPVQVPMLDGRRIMFAYHDEDFFANLKVEILPEQGYASAREALIGDFDHTLATGGGIRNYALKPTLNGFDIRGLDREKREGGVLGIYLLFDDAKRIVTTIYFLNQEPPKRFQTMAEYAVLRDRFLKQFTACAHGKKT